MDLLDVYAKLSLDTDGYERGMQSAEGTASTFSSNVGSRLASIAKVSAEVIAGIAAATTTAIVAVTKTAVANYAEYEQLIGGVETMYKESSGVIMQYANDAYKNAGLSANEYMETITGFSASLIQSLGGDTELAAEVGNRAIEDMSDNANKMGTDMSSIQNAYQGFAKQNYTMLDNLKLGYGGTQEEMKRLIADASQMTEEMAELGVTVDSTDMSFANIVNAISVVQKSLDITGTTTKEASTTIQGSITSMKSAWTNLMTSLGDENADLEKLVDNVVETATTAVENIVPVVERTFVGIADAVDKLIPVISEKLPNMIQTLLPKLVQSATSLIEGLASALPTLLTVISSQIPSLFNSIMLVLIKLLPTLVDVALQAVYTIANGLTESLPELVPAVVEIITKIVEVLLDNLTPIIDAAIEIILALNEGIIAALPILIDSLPMIISKLVETLLTLTPQLLYVGLIMIEQMSRGMVQAIVTLVSNIPAMFVGIYQGIVGTLWNAKDIGINLVKGIWEGMQSMYSWMTKKVSSFGNDIMKSIKNVLGIHSPSREFAKIGRFMVEGMGEGWEDEIGDVKGSMIDDMDFSAQSASVSVASQSGQNSNLVSLLEEYLPQIANMQIVMDTGATVGQLVSPINDALGIMTDYSGRMVTV